MVVAFDRVGIWLDQENREPVRQGVDWASRLHLSVKGIILRSTDRGIACDLADWCVQEHLPYELAIVDDSTPATLSTVLQSTGLLAVPHRSSAACHEGWLSECLSTFALAVMILPSSPAAGSRVLLLDSGTEEESFFERALALCRQLTIEPVILSVAETVSRAEARQKEIKSVLGSATYDFDLVVGTEMATAVRCVAHWRRCQLLMMAGPVNLSHGARRTASPIQCAMELGRNCTVVLLPAVSRDRMHTNGRSLLPAAN
jgi:hypothetical protein